MERIGGCWMDSLKAEAVGLNEKPEKEDVKCSRQLLVCPEVAKRD